jgi:predicted enzyme related to lactoylglutathione lyase
LVTHSFLEARMKTIARTTLSGACVGACVGACAALLLASAAYADVTLNSVRIGAANTVTLAQFYRAAFGLWEVNRIEVPGGPEIFLNVGATAEAAKANTAPPVVLMHRDSDAVKDPMAHLILTVTDMKATVAAIKAAGGTMDGEPRPFRDTGIVIGIATDPAGNKIELIQRAARP